LYKGKTVRSHRSALIDVCRAVFIERGYKESGFLW
jgi:pyrimidine operon attenuation protein/uracil phosphoribosyltransferase